jgi:hypothetical protein
MTRHIAASFNVEKLVPRIPCHLSCLFAEQQNNTCSIGAIPNATTSQMYTMTTYKHQHKVVSMDRVEVVRTHNRGVAAVGHHTLQGTKMQSVTSSSS